MFGIHNLQPLCGNEDPQVITPEKLRQPFLDAGRICATNGHAILFVRDAGLADGLSQNGPPLSKIDEMPWIKKEAVVSLPALREFVRRDPRRDAVSSLDGKTRELVIIYGVTIDASLLRRYLPGGYGSVCLARCKKLDWRPTVDEPPALRLRGDGWELIVMALIKGDPKEWAVFPDSARKGASAA
jgi:hypothetical protein